MKRRIEDRLLVGGIVLVVVGVAAAIAVFGLLIHEMFKAADRDDLPHVVAYAALIVALAASSGGRSRS